MLILLATLAVTPATLAQTQTIAKVSVLSAGKLLLNGKPVTLAELDADLKKLKQANGIVWYYRESAAAEPPPQAMAALKLIVENSLPVSMSSKPDFSDYIDASGRSKRRER
jgi:biopolymer transport protein ExbD